VAEQQIQLVLENENAIALADALTHSGTAMDHLTTFMRTRNPTDLAAADNESDLGIHFFLALPATASDLGQASQTQPYFLPGIAKAGTVRILVSIARDGNALWRVEADVTQIQEIIALMEGMLSSIKGTVNAAHTVVWGTEPAVACRMGLLPRGARPGTAVLFGGSGGYQCRRIRDYPEARCGRQSCGRRRASGWGTAELAFMGIPQ